GLDTTAAADRHEGDLACAGVGRERAVTDAEVEVPPPRRFRRHVLPLPFPPEELRHTSSASSSSRRGTASEQASLDATTAPAIEPRRTASTSGRPPRRPCPTAAANASPAPSPFTTSTGKTGTSVSTPFS